MAGRDHSGIGSSEPLSSASAGNGLRLNLAGRTRLELLAQELGRFGASSLQQYWTVAPGNDQVVSALQGALRRRGRLTKRAGDLVSEEEASALRGRGFSFGGLHPWRAAPSIEM